MKGPSTRLGKPGPPVRPLKEKEPGPSGELSTSNAGVVAPEVAPNVSALGADDADMGDEVAPRSVSDAESVGGDELREPRRQNRPSDTSSREIEDHVLTGPVVSWDYCFLGARNHLIPAEGVDFPSCQKKSEDDR